MTTNRSVAAAQVESDVTRDDPYPPDSEFTQPGRAGSVVQSVRLPAEALAAVERIAARTEVPVSALIRGWVFDGLAREDTTSLADAVARLRADVDHLSRLAEPA